MAGRRAIAATWRRLPSLLYCAVSQVSKPAEWPLGIASHESKWRALLVGPAPI